MILTARVMKHSYIIREITCGKRPEKICSYFSTGSTFLNAGERLPCTNKFKMEKRLEISMIIKINTQSRYLLDELLPLWGGNEINLILAEKLREESTNDEEESIPIPRSRRRHSYTMTK